MQRGLHGRRIAATTPDETTNDALGVVEDALTRAGAEVEVLGRQSADESWHGGLYAALVIVGADGDDGATADPRLVQLVREFLVSEKPVAAQGSGVRVVIEAGGAAGRILAVDAALKAPAETSGGRVVEEPVHADGSLISAQGGASIEQFAGVVVKEFSRHLEEGALDDMSAQSFPASDPPATTPASAGPAGDADARP